MTRNPHLQTLLTVARRPAAWAGAAVVLVTGGLAASAGFDDEPLPLVFLFVPAVFLGFLGAPMLAWFSAPSAMLVPGHRAVHERVGWGLLALGLALLWIGFVAGGFDAGVAAAVLLGLTPLFLTQQAAASPSGRGWLRGWGWLDAAAAGLWLLVFVLVLVERPAAVHEAFTAGRLPLLSVALILWGVAVLLAVARRLRADARSRAERNLPPAMSIADRVAANDAGKLHAASGAPAGEWPAPAAVTPGGAAAIAFFAALVAACFVLHATGPGDGSWLNLLAWSRWFGAGGLVLFAVIASAGRLWNLFTSLPAAVHRTTPRAAVARDLFRRAARLGLLPVAAGLAAGAGLGLERGLPPAGVAAAGGVAAGLLACLWCVLVRTLRAGPRVQFGVLMGGLPLTGLLLPLSSVLGASLLGPSAPVLAAAVLLLAAALALSARRWILRLEWGTLP